MSALNKNSNTIFSNNEVDLMMLFRIMSKQKILFIFLITLSLIFSVFFALSLPNKYQSSVLLTVSQEDSIESSLSQYGSLAGLAGISLPSQTNNSSLALEVIKSRIFVEKFIENNNLLIPLLGAKSWDMSTNNLIIDDQLYDNNKKIWVRDVDYPKTSKPSFHEAYDFWITDVFSYVENKKDGFITINVKHFSPFLTKEWSDLLINDLNDYMREIDVSEAELSIEYLQNEINNTNSEELKKLFYQLIQRKIEKKMLAYSKTEYILRIIDPPIAPENKYSPQRSIIVILGFLIGIIFSSFLILIIHLFRVLKKQT
jgi:LPS O-antigen subunit length determinant protein (WzzB/FepE family)